MIKGPLYEFRNVKVGTNIYLYIPIVSNLRLLFLEITDVRALSEDVACIPRYGF